jgi:hypothetical protein
MLARTTTVRRQDLEDKEETEATGAEGAASSESRLWAGDNPGSRVVRERVQVYYDGLISFIEKATVGQRFSSFERELYGMVFQFGRMLIALFLALAEERTEVPITERRGRKEYRQQPAKPRLLGTFFGRVRYWRAYMFQVNGQGGGYFPLDLRLGLSADGFTANVLSRVALLATKVSFAAVTTLMLRFSGWSPSTTTIEQAVLGLGRHTCAWNEQREAPEGDGDVLAIQIDCKAVPTARESELSLRRGERKSRPSAPSPRHRSREARAARPPKRRRKKGDKSKNGKAATLVVMYTLRSERDANGEPILLGPINRWIYASYAPKRHAFAIARREADKRGFTQTSGKLVHLLTDGDDDLEYYAKEIFPEALHSLDAIHAVEKIWEAGACFYRESSEELSAWMVTQKEDLYTGRIDKVIAELRSRRLGMRPGKKNEEKRKRLDDIAKYLEKRVHMMKYDEYLARDLDIATGMVEGAVRFVISQRFDEGGMRWIKERAEALLQLRCIEINGDWDRFADFAENRILSQQERTHQPRRQLVAKPIPLPNLGVRPC